MIKYTIAQNVSKKNTFKSSVDTPNLQQMVFPTRMSSMWLNLICLAISHAHGHGVVIDKLKVVVVWRDHSYSTLQVYKVLRKTVLICKRYICNSNSCNWSLQGKAGADPGFQVRGADLKKLCRAEGGAKIFGIFRVKNHDFTPKNHIISKFRGARSGCAPSGSYPARIIIAMQMWLNLGINIKITMLGTIPMHALWRKVVLFIIEIIKNQLSPILKLNRVINRIVWLKMVFFMITCQKIKWLSLTISRMILIQLIK